MLLYGQCQCSRKQPINLELSVFKGKYQTSAAYRSVNTAKSRFLDFPVKTSLPVNK